MRRVTIKVGSNVLTRPDKRLDVTRMSSLVDQIVELRRSAFEVILVSSGAVASGRGLITPERKLDSVEQRQLYSAVGQSRLISRYYDLFSDSGIIVGQVLTTKESFSTRRNYLNQRNCMRVMLENGVLPIVNENDTVSVTELMFTDNDELSGLVASMMDCDTLVILSNIDGVYDGNPSEVSSRVIEEVAPGEDLSKYITNVKSEFGRGGMLSKSSVASKAAEEGIEVIIANGRRENVLTDILLGRGAVPCTRFSPLRDRKVNDVKKWIAHSQDFAKGVIVVTDFVAESLRSGKVMSILPVGIIGVKGEFEKDDIVKIQDSSGEDLGVGKTGCGSSSVRESMGRHGGKPVVHYDYLFIES